MAYFSVQEIENLRPVLDKMVYRVLGSSDDKVRNIVENCLFSGFDRKRTIDKLNDVIDSKKASRMYDKLEDLLEENKNNAKSRKRPYEEDERKERDFKKPKPTRNDREPSKPKEEEAAPPAPKEESSLTSQQIKLMMVNAQREIEERKRALTAMKTKDPSQAADPQSTPPVEVAAPKMQPTNPEDIARAKKIADLQAQIRAKLSGSLSAIIPQVQEKPKPLILDEEGRTVDKAGRAISIPTLAPTLKANIRAKKKEIFNKASQPTERMYEDDTQKFFDDRITAKSAFRSKRALRFHEPGKFQQMAERMRMKSQLEKLQNEISQIARKTGISSATKLALIAPKQDSHADDVPTMEWWDSVILANDLSTMDGDKIAIRESAISNLIEHPTQMKPPSEYKTESSAQISVFKFFVVFFRRAVETVLHASVPNQKGTQEIASSESPRSLEGRTGENSNRSSPTARTEATNFEFDACTR